ncbi:MAG: histidine phosphatase family protein [Bacteroidetes bacterium]|nr:histidine phosphatase family protein [Bacteroidota bacterium]
MMKFTFATLLLLFATILATAQNEKLTTFILLRHAEKVTDGTKDPDLNEAGMARAENLVSLFKNTTIEAIYSTAFVRTRKTVEPLGKSKSLIVKEYEANKLEAIDKMLQAHEGKTILVCGHSNTIPKIANHLSKKGNYKDFDDADYGNILIVTVSAKRKSASVTWLHY